LGRQYRRVLAKGNNEDDYEGMIEGRRRDERLIEKAIGESE
jgi:hypothetical protein